MKALIYINRHIVARNKKLGKNDPAICINTYKKKTYCHQVQIAEATLIQDPNHAFVVVQRFGWSVNWKMSILLHRS